MQFFKLGKARMSTSQIKHHHPQKSSLLSISLIFVPCGLSSALSLRLELSQAFDPVPLLPYLCDDQHPGRVSGHFSSINCIASIGGLPLRP
jgi:hypothetical protein